MRIPYRLLLSFLLALFLLIGGIATTVGASVQRAVAVRGWANPAQSANLPYRMPLAGINVELTQYSGDALNAELDKIASAGFVWVRQFIYWQDVELAEHQFDFSKYDPIVEAVSKHPTIKLIVVLHGSPAWARQPEASDRITAPPASMAAFGSFAAEVADRYGHHVDYYQIWDEPNLNTQWGGLDPRPADYAAMLKSSYAVIKGKDSTATIITAALAPTVEIGPRNLSDVLFLRALYEVGAKDAFDAVAGKPYGFDSGPDDRRVNRHLLNFSHLILLREEMLKYGDRTKALWGMNFGWNHLPDGWQGPPSIWGQVDEATQKRYTREAYQRATQEWSWLGGLILYHWSPPAPADDPIQGFKVADKASDWFENGAFFKHDMLTTGLYDPSNSLLNYTGDWRFGPLGADVQFKGTGEALADGSEHVLKFTFDGPSLALQLRRADYVAYVYAQIDGKPANALPRTPDGKDGYILLKSPTLQESTDLITIANNLPAGPHTAEIRFYLGYERWVLAGVAIGAQPDTRRYDLLIAGGALAALVGLISAIVLGWLASRQMIPNSPATIAAYVRRMGDVLAGLAMSLLTVLGLVITWNGALPDIVRRDTPTLALTILTAGLAYFSHTFILTLIAIVILWLLIYNRPVIGLALVIFWSPFFLAPVQLYIWAIPMVELCLLLALSAGIVRLLVQRAWRTFSWSKVSPLDWALLAFVVLATLTLAWSEQRSPALRAWRIMVIEPALYYFLLRTTPLTKADMIKLVDTFIFAGTLIALMGLINYVVGGTGVIIAENGARRLAGVYGSYASPNNLALFLGRCIPFALAMGLIVTESLRRLVALVVTLVMGIALILTQSGGGLLLGVPVAVICILILWNRRARIVAGVLALGMVVLVPLSRFIPRLANIFDPSRSSSFIRTQVWQSAVNLIGERPILGAGLDQFLYLYRSRYILPDAWREPDLSHPHNVVLDYWISLGILGLLVLAALQFSFWQTAIRAWQRFRGEDLLMTALVVGAMGSMADFLAHGFVDNSYFVVDLAYIFCFTVGVIYKTNHVQSESVS
jgi:O-antigen ligase